MYIYIYRERDTYIVLYTLTFHYTTKHSTPCLHIPVQPCILLGTRVPPSAPSVCPEHRRSSACYGTFGLRIPIMLRKAYRITIAMVLDSVYEDGRQPLECKGLQRSDVICRPCASFSQDLDPRRELRPKPDTHKNWVSEERHKPAIFTQEQLLLMQGGGGNCVRQPRALCQRVMAWVKCSQWIEYGAYGDHILLLVSHVLST